MGAKFLLISHILLGFVQIMAGNRTAHLFDFIYQFGDSLTDTGNLIREDPNTICSKPPHGLDLYDRPSNGLLMIDFYGSVLAHGVNFTVGGATALDSAILAEKNITSSPATNSSLSVQVEWFKHHLRTICSSTVECKVKLSKALILMGEIGANDYSYPLYKGNSIYDLYPLVPFVIDRIKISVQEIIDVGASLLVVPGDFPIGCMPQYLYTFQSNDTDMYDELHCLKHFNEFAIFHNDRLQRALEELRFQNPSVTLIYNDNYNPFRQLLRNVVSLGFDKDEVFKPCCEKIEENYNCDASKGAPWCKDPRKRVFWDGTDPTQEVYKILIDWSLGDMFKMKNSPSCSDVPGTDMISMVNDI